MGGLARLASLLDEERSIADLPVVIDVGDVAGDPVEDSGLPFPVEPELARRVRSRIAQDSLAAIGYDIMVPGERDLTTGALPLATTIAANGAVMLTTNVWVDAEARALGDVVYWIETDYGDVALLSALSSLDDDQLAAARRGHDAEIEVVDAAHSLSLLLPDVRERAAFVVLLAHGPLDWARELVSDVKGIDLCVASHDAYDPSQIEVTDETILLQTGRNGEFVVRFHVYLASNGEVSFGGSVLAVEQTTYAERADVLELVDSLEVRLEEAQTELNTANEGAPHPSGATYLGFATCGECHAEETDSWYSSPHIEAFQALNRVGWHVEPTCFECHSTGFGFDSGFESHQRTPSLSGVTCEACHGPASEYVQAMRASGTADVDDVAEETCRGCHRDDRDPEFDFAADLIRAGLGEDGHL